MGSGAQRGYTVAELRPCREASPRSWLCTSMPCKVCSGNLPSFPGSLAAAEGSAEGPIAVASTCTASSGLGLAVSLVGETSVGSPVKLDKAAASGLTGAAGHRGHEGPFLGSITSAASPQIYSVGRRPLPPHYGTISHSPQIPCFPVSAFSQPMSCTAEAPLPSPRGRS